MTDTPDYTLQLALLRELVGVPLENDGEYQGCYWWSTNTKLVGNNTKWITVGTGHFKKTPGSSYISVLEGSEGESNPDPRNWLFMSCIESSKGESKKPKILWPPVPFERLINLLQDPKFRQEYMLPKLKRGS